MWLDISIPLLSTLSALQTKSSVTLLDTFAYLDNMLLVRKYKGHDISYRRFTEVAERLILTYNYKCTFFVTESKIKPHPERLWPQKELPPLQDMNLLHCAIGIYVYYSYWIANYYEKIILFIQVSTAQDD